MSVFGIQIPWFVVKTGHTWLEFRAHIASGWLLPRVWMYLFSFNVNTFQHAYV